MVSLKFVWQETQAVVVCLVTFLVVGKLHISTGSCQNEGKWERGVRALFMGSVALAGEAQVE